jgi:hypothetical protein
MKLFFTLFLLNPEVANHLCGNDEPFTTTTVLSRANHRVLEADLVGTYVKSAIQHENYMSENENIEINDGSGTIYTITNPGKSGWAETLRSGVSIIIIGKGDTIRGALIDMKGNPPKGKPEGTLGNPFDRYLKEDEVLTPEQEANVAKLKDQRRHLATVIGTKSVIAVKVNHTGLGSFGTTTNTATGLADSIFGTAAGGSDAVNMYSQYKACSHGKLEMLPAANRASSNGAVSNIVNGVVEVTVNTNCATTPCDGQTVNEVNNALSAAFGSEILGGSLANHVMHCLPNTAMNGIAYTYVNHWNSVYANQ